MKIPMFRWQSRLPFTLVLIASVVTSSAQAQDVSSLRARVAAAPDDVSLQCQLAFALVTESNFEEALSTAERAIARFPRPASRASRRTLGACLYNRGRAQEGLGHTRDSVQDYLRSLRVRPNEAVSARILTLVPDALPGYLPTALAVLDLPPGENVTFQSETASLSSPRGTTWHFVTGAVTIERGFTELVAYAFAETEADLFYRRIDTWTQEDNSTQMRVTGLRAFRTPTLEGASLVTDAAGGGACGGMDGFADFEHHALVLLALVNETIRTRTIVTRQSDCNGPVRHRARIRGPNLVLVQAADGLPAGEHSIPSVLRE